MSPWQRWILTLLYLCAEFGHTTESYVFGRADFSTGKTPNGVATADFNGDGNPDFAVVNSTDNTVSVFLGNAHGKFTRTDYSVGLNPISIAVADFNLDGHPDLVVINNGCANNNCIPGSASVLINKGDGTFLNSVLYGTETTDLVGVTVGDFNGDGRLDFAIANAITPVIPVPGTVSIFLNQGNGRFIHKGDYYAGAGVGNVVGFTPAKGGTPSLAITNFTALNGVNQVVVLRGNGDGSFQGPISYPTGKVPSGLATTDLNGDGNPDLAVVNAADHSVSILLGRSDGSFASKVDYPVAFGPHNVAVGDFNGDHIADLIVTAGTTEPGGGAVSLLIGKGDGTFLPAVQYITGNNPTSIVAADFNTDGHVDVALANGDVNRVSILLGKGDGTFPSAISYFTGRSPIAVASVDINRDGWSDLIVVNSGSDSISVFLNKGDGTFTLRHIYSVGLAPQGIAVGDVNGDRQPDLVVTNSGDNTVSVLLGNGDGTFALRHTYSVGLAPQGIAVGDLNGDHQLDIVVANSGDNTISVLLGNGDGTFQSQASYATSAGPCSIAIADLNGDGMPDLAVADRNTPLRVKDPGLVSVFLNKGNGAFLSKTDFAVGPHPDAVIAVDLNEDGKPDLVLATNLGISGVVSILIGNGDGTFQPQATYAEGFSIYGLAAADFDADGHVDLAVTSSEDSTVFVLAGDGKGRFRTQGTYGTEEGPVSVAVGHFVPNNTMSGMDTAIANFYSNSISILNNIQIYH